MNARLHPRLQRLNSGLLGVRLLPLLLMLSCEVEPDVVGKMRAASGGTSDSDPSAFGGASGAGATSGDNPTPRGQLDVTGDILVHDPSLIEEDGLFYLFGTGEGLPYKTSDDLQHWRAAGRAFETVPESLSARLPNVSELWAPDISYDGQRYHLYFAGSTFGTGESCIGHATKNSLAAEEPWREQPLVICSNLDSTDDFDAIDPSAFTDDGGQRWLVFGSYHTGIKLIALDEDGGWSDSAIVPLAERPSEVAIQAAHLLYREPFYYLISSFGTCCSGVNSTSSLHVGRSTHEAGPYLDREGVSLLEGGGSLLIERGDRYRAVGGSTSIRARGVDYLAYHAYDANEVGQAVLRIVELRVDEQGWILANP